MIRIVNRHGVITETTCKTLAKLEKEYTILKTDNILMPNGIRYSRIISNFKYPIVVSNEVYFSVKTYWNEENPDKSKYMAEKLINGKANFVSVSIKLAKEILHQNIIQNK